MGLLDDLKNNLEEVLPSTPGLDPGLDIFINEVAPVLDEIIPVITEELTEFDPTNPDAEHGDMTRLIGDAAINVVTDGAAGPAFSQASQGVEDLNHISHNSFTAHSIGEVVDDVVNFMPPDETSPGF